MPGGSKHWSRSSGKAGREANELGVRGRERGDHPGPVLSASVRRRGRADQAPVAS
jgi:hypothetical protein